MQKKQRLFQYDFIRVIAMLMVLALHVELKTRYFRVDYNIPWYFSNSIIIFLIVCNPIFFMISGKFNLRCQLISISDYFDYYKKKFINIFIPFFLFSATLFVLKNYKDFHLNQFIIDFLSGKIEGTYWFLYPIICMLIMTPFLSKLVNNMSLTDKKVFFLVLFSIDIFLFMTSIFKLNNSFSQKNFAVMGWYFYYLMGYLIEDIFVTKKNRKYIILLGGIALFIQFILYIGLKLPISYLKNPNPILTLQVFGLYFFLLEYADIFSYKIKQGISFVSKYSFNFYLVHNFVIRYLSRLFDFQISFIRNILYGILLFIIAFGTSLFISVVINYVALKPIQSNLSNLLNIKKINNKS